MTDDGVKCSPRSSCGEEMGPPTTARRRWREAMAQDDGANEAMERGDEAAAGLRSALGGDQFILPIVPKEYREPTEDY